MRKLVVLGAPGSGRKTLIDAVKRGAPQLQLELYSGRIPAQVEGAVLVVSSADGPMPETLEQLKAAKRAGVSQVWCVLSKSDQIDDADLAELVTLECREMAYSVGYADENFRVTAAANGEGVAEFITGGQAPASGAAPGGQIKCVKCPYSQPMPFDTCPSCGEGQSRSFWSRLFG